MMVLYVEHVKEPGGALGNFVLYPCNVSTVTTNRLLGALLRWAPCSNNK